jgi:hypothetical protein
MITVLVPWVNDGRSERNAVGGTAIAAIAAIAIQDSMNVNLYLIDSVEIHIH